MKNYILDDNNQPIESDESWEWMRENMHRKITCKTIFPDGTRISTVFLGLDHGWGHGDPPVLWETMIFDSPHKEFQDFQDRYTSYKRAIEGHIAMVEAVIAKIREKQ